VCMCVCVCVILRLSLYKICNGLRDLKRSASYIITDEHSIKMFIVNGTFYCILSLLLTKNV